jgi:zinc protease
MTRDNAPMRNTAALLVLACTAAVGTIVVAQSAQTMPSTLRIPFESYALPNGLRVVLAPNNASPTVAVTMWYHVGSKNYGVHDRLTEGVGGTLLLRAWPPLPSSAAI